MADLNLSGIDKNGGFVLRNKQPVDKRIVVEEYDHLRQLSDKGWAYEGMIVYVKETQHKGHYFYTATAWKPFAEGHSSISCIEPEFFEYLY